MNERFSLRFPATEVVRRRAQVGVVCSGDLEVLLLPSESEQSSIEVITRVSGFQAIWAALLERFFLRHPYRIHLEIHDSGATPGVVSLRLEEALELALQESANPEAE